MDGHYVPTPIFSCNELYEDDRNVPYASYTGGVHENFQDYQSQRSEWWQHNTNALGIQEVSQTPYLTPPASEHAEIAPSLATPKRERKPRLSSGPVTSPLRRSARISSRNEK